MQLILEPETNIDIKVKMSTFEFDQTSVDKKLVTNSSAEDLKNGISDIKKATDIQESVVINAEESIAIDSDKENVDEAILVEDNIISLEKQDDEVLCDQDVSVKEESAENVATNTSNIKETIAADTSNIIETIATNTSNIEETIATNTSNIEETIATNTSNIKETIAANTANIKETIATSTSNIKESIATNTFNIEETTATNTSDIKETVAADTSNINETITGDTSNIKETTATNSSNIKETTATNTSSTKETIATNTSDIKETIAADTFNIKETVVADTSNVKETITTTNTSNIKETIAVDTSNIKETIATNTSNIKETITTNTSNINENIAIDNKHNENLDLEESQNDIVCLEEDKDDDVIDAEVCLKDDSTRESEKMHVDIEPSEVNNKSDSCTTNNVTDNVIDCDEITEITTNIKDIPTDITSSECKEDILDIDDVKEMVQEVEKSDKQEKIVSVQQININESIVEERKKTPICKLSNNLEIFSDDDEDTPKQVTQNDEPIKSTDKQCINIEDDDDIMFIEDTNSNPGKNDINELGMETVQVETVMKPDSITSNQEDCKEIENVENIEPNMSPTNEIEIFASEIQAEAETKIPDTQSCTAPEINEKPIEEQSENFDKQKPLVPEKFLNTYKKNLADMTRDDLEEFCILKIVESIVDRSNLSEIKTKLKTITQNIDEYKKKALMFCKQNRDLQVVLKSIQEEQKNQNNTPITPLKITRSVGMQVSLPDKPPGIQRRSVSGQMEVSGISNNNANTRKLRNSNNQSNRAIKPTNNSQLIPVPRLVPATNNPANKTANANSVNSQVKGNTVPNGLRSSPTAQVQKTAEKRSHNKIQSVTVDLTDDEPPSKMAPRNGPVPPVRLVPSQNLLASQRPQFGQPLNSPRKVYIPISGPQGQNVKGQTIMLKTVTPQIPRQRGPLPHMVRMPQNSVRVPKMQANRHPAPLPDCMKQYQHPNWKALPPAPDLKLSKVENGIVISWKIEGYQDDSYEEIASYQLYAYQETSSPPSTALWKKIGDVKALPLPMACTLTQFMAGYKYYFAVRAVDVKSRVGPFSVPGSILLLNKM